MLWHLSREPVHGGWVGQHVGSKIVTQMAFFPFHCLCRHYFLLASPLLSYFGGIFCSPFERTSRQPKTAERRECFLSCPLTITNCFQSLWKFMTVDRSQTYFQTLNWAKLVANFALWFGSCPFLVCSKISPFYPSQCKADVWNCNLGQSSELDI